ncbi:hypothetical protein AB2762_13670 [Acinetobacter indicus]
MLLSAVIALRTLYLFVVLQPTNQILSNNLVAAGTQLIILCLSLLMAGLLFHSAYQDIFQQLQKERNLDPLTSLLKPPGAGGTAETLKTAQPFQTECDYSV